MKGVNSLTIRENKLVTSQPLQVIRVEKNGRLILLNLKP